MEKGYAMSYAFNTTEERSRLMKRIRSTETVSEIAFRKALWRYGLRYRKNYAKLPGKPDIAITTLKIAVFIDGEFWHGYHWEDIKEHIKPNRDYWIPKIEKTIIRDRVNNEKIKEMGWQVIRFWEKNVKKDINGCVDAVLFLAKQQQLGGGK